MELWLAIFCGLSETLDLSVMLCWHEQSGVSVNLTILDFLTNVNPPLFLCFSLFLCVLLLFHVSSLGRCWILIGGGARLVLWCCPSTRLVGSNCRSPPTHGCIPMVAPTLYCTDKLFFLPQYVFGLIHLHRVVAAFVCGVSSFSLSISPLPPMSFCFPPIFLFQNLQQRDWKPV